jgi:5-methylcytosine-specific restriction enzyme subunit McrC
LIRRSIFEWRRIAYGTGQDEIPGWAADRLAAVAKASPLGGESGARILDHGRHALRAGQVVGVIAGEGCSLEILPKIEGLDDAAGKPDQARIRQRLVHMLAVALDMDIADGRITDLGWQREDLLEILIKLFSRRLADAVRLGLPRRYVQHQDDLQTVRGRIDVKRQFTSLAAAPQLVACRYDTLSPDIALNQVMKAAVQRLAQVSRSVDNQRLLRELALTYVDIASVPISALRWDQINLDRTNERWRELLSLAKLLLGERFQTTTAGSAGGFSLLFEMNTLFEEYVARMLGRALAVDGLKVHRQGGRLFCLEENDEPRRQRFQTIPDIIVKRGSETLLIIDTKWKRLGARIDDPKLGVSQADVYQMMAYGRVYRCPRLMLLYPHHAALGDQERIMASYRVAGSEDALSVATLDISSPTPIAIRLLNLTRRHLSSDSLAPLSCGTF